MDYVEKWERMREYCKELEEKKDRHLLYLLDNPYGFKLNVYHPLIIGKYEEFKKANGLGRHSCFLDDYRRQFEQEMMNSEYFKDIGHKNDECDRRNNRR